MPFFRTSEVASTPTLQGHNVVGEATSVKHLSVCTRSVVSYETLEMPLFSQEKVAGSEKLNTYDSIDDDVLQSYNEFALASLLYYTMKEGAASEQSSRMTAMDSASKNAGECYKSLKASRPPQSCCQFSNDDIDVN